MRQRVSMGLRVVSSAVALVYFWANVAMAHSTESNVWAQRRRHMENNCAGASDNPLLASLPVPASSLAQLPSLSLPAKTNSALNDDLAKSLPAGFAAKHAALFNALPTAHGTIRKIWLPANNAGDRIVVHIQDVHQNLEAQRHIGGAVDALLQAHQADLVALEGAFAPIDVKAYHDFGDRDAIAQTADCLLRENLITGPVRTFMTTPAVLPPLVGVDDQTHYNANVEAYRQSAPRVEEFKREIAAQKKDMERAKAGVFSNELLAFDAVVGAYKEERASLGDYVAALSPTKGVGQTGLLAQALAMEKEIDFQQVERERKELIDGLVKNLSKSQIDQLIQESVAYRAGEVRYGEFYRSLQSLCHEAKIELSRFPRMDAYICYVMLSDRIDGEKLLGEMATLEKERYANLARLAEEKVLVARSNELRLKERLLNFALTPVEWAEYKTLKSSEVPSPARGRGQGEGARSDVDGGLTLTSFVSFYESAQARDDDMARNLLVSMDKGNVKQAVLVTGGYHTEGVAQRLQAAGVTVVTFTPRIEKLDTAQGSAYLSIFTQEKTPLEKLFAGEKLFVSQLVAADHVVKKGGLATLLVTALEALKGVPSRAIAATLKYFGADPATFDVSVKHGVVTIKEWGQDARAAVQTIVQRTAEGYITFKESVVVTSGERPLASIVRRILFAGVFVFFLLPGVAKPNVLVEQKVGQETGETISSIAMFDAKSKTANGLPAPLADALTAAVPVPEARAGVPSIEQIEDPLQSYFQTRYKSFQDGWLPFQWMKQFERERFVRDFLLMDRGVIPVDDAWVGRVLEGIDFDSVTFEQLIEKIRSQAEMAQPGTFVESDGRNVGSGLSRDWVGNMKGAFIWLFFSYFIGFLFPNYFRYKRLQARIDKLLPNSLKDFIAKGESGTRVGIYGFDRIIQSAIEIQCRFSRRKPEILTGDELESFSESGGEEGGASLYDQLVIEVPDNLSGEDQYRQFFHQFYPFVPVNGTVYFWAKPWINGVLPDETAIKRVFHQAGFVIMPESASPEFIVKKIPDNLRRPTHQELIEELFNKFSSKDPTSSFFLRIRDFSPYMALLFFEPFSMGFIIAAVLAAISHYAVGQYRIGKLDMDLLVRAVGGDREASLTLYLPHEQAMTAVDGRPGNNAGSLRASDALTRLREGRSFWSPYRFGQRAALRAHLKDHPASLVGQGSGAIFSRLMRMASGERATPQQSVPLVVHPVATQTELAEAVALARSLAELNSLSPKNPVFLAIIPDGEINSKDIQTALAGTPLGHVCQAS